MTTHLPAVRVRLALALVTPRRHRGLKELGLVAALYLAYTASRALGDDRLGPARHRADQLLRLETGLHLDGEHALNRLFAAHAGLGVTGDYWYAVAHYAVTPVVLVWLFRQGTAAYVPARRALALATVVGLCCYLFVPTAPPRLVGGYVDVMSLHAGDGWWGSDASVPRGLGGLTDQLAAFPSLHAGWALWVALAVTRASRSRTARIAGWLHALATAVVVVGTANHWVVDVLAGWVLVVVSWYAAVGRASRQPDDLCGVREPGAEADQKGRRA